MNNDQAWVGCPNCGERLWYPKRFHDDERCVAFCKNVDCFYVFCPATGKEIERKDYLVHQRPYTGSMTLGIRPERHGTFHHDNEPQNINVPCPRCGRIFHQTKRMNRGPINFKCPKCRHRFEMDPRHCVLTPQQVSVSRRVSKGVSPDRMFPQLDRPKITYCSAPCPDCDKKVEFVSGILKYENHVVICKDCGTCFDPVTRKVVLRRPPGPKPAPSQDEIKDLLKEGSD